ncbi:MAG: PilT/PilU family type 4a pilus ATPase [Candidatus Eremiobacteraeota bacterium]|nr:PilT/PilU family type 4a pilus ATPase [Candidatus Eremiobacteraeota bacterium]
MNASIGAIRWRDTVQLARAQNASDVHLEAGIPPVLRVDGELCFVEEAPLSARDVGAIAETLLEGRAVPPEGDVSLSRRDDGGAMRVHAYRALGGIAVAVRMLPAGVPALESLRLPDAVAALAKEERGLAIFAGPTGSGKSTTMAAVVDRINASAAKRIVTIEDPIEYRHGNRRSVVTQREIGRDTPTLAAALRGVLRADPDVIVVGELRDPDAIRGALTAAETGHLVFATVHTGDAPQTVDRLVDAFSGGAAEQVRAQLAGVLLAVVCQRLVRRADGSGRRAAVEIMIGTEGVKNLIRDGKSHQLSNAIATGKQFGMQALEQHVRELRLLREIA